MDLLPLPTNVFDGQVTAGAGPWLAGVIDGVEGVRWRDGRLDRLGQAFDLDTTLNGVNADGDAVGSVTGPDHRQHAITYRAGRYEYLPESSGTSTALDVNARGETVGYDGAALVVWPDRGPARVLAMPPGATAFGHPAIDDDGTVVARTGHLDGDTMRWQSYAWTPRGASHPLPLGDVQDVNDGQVVGLSAPGADPVTTTSGSSLALGWSLDDGRPHVYPGGTTAVAVNRDGVVVGAGTSGEPLLWTGIVPTPLPTPRGYYPGEVAALNDREAGGFVSPGDDSSIVPVRWRCR